MFREEFNIKNDADVSMFVKFVNSTYSENEKELKMKTAIVKHVECGNVVFCFSDSFKIADIPDDAIINMLDNIENKVLNAMG